MILPVDLAVVWSTNVSVQQTTT